MKAIDITNDLQGFRTVRTPISDPRARELETPEKDDATKSIMSGKQASEPSEPEPSPEAESAAWPAADCRFDSGVFLDWPTGKPAVRSATRGGTEAQWLAVAGQVCGGEFLGADSSTIEAVFIGLRGVAHPLGRRALLMLAGEAHCPPRVRKAIKEGGTR